MNRIESTDVGAKEAIDMSIRENRIVRITDPSGSQAVVLDELAEGHADNDAELEFWGTREADGGEWRVHVVHAG